MKVTQDVVLPKVIKQFDVTFSTSVVQFLVKQ